MSPRSLTLSTLMCVLTLSGTAVFAQTGQSRQPGERAEGPEQASPPANSLEAVANQIDLLRKSVQTLNARLREISDKLATTDPKTGSGAADKQSRIAQSLELLARAEERAGVLRKQLIDVMEKETTYRSRLAQIHEDMRPENIERGMSGIGTTRTAEARDVRRRSLEIEKRGVEGLLNINSQSRQRLDEDFKQAEILVTRLRQRLLPLMEKEIEKINPN